MAIRRQEVALIWTDDVGFGGVAQYAHSMALGLKASGFTVVFVQPQGDTYLQRERTRQSITHIFFPGDPTSAFINSLSHHQFADIVLNQVQPSFILFANCCPFSNLASRETAALQNVPFVVTEGFAEAYLSTSMPFLVERNELNYAQSFEVIGVSLYTLSILRSHFRLPSHLGKLIHYGRPERFFIPANRASRMIKRSELGIADSTCVVTMLARLSAVKGHDILLAALTKFIQSTNTHSIRVVIAGTGELEGELQSKILEGGLSNYVTLLSHVDETDALLDASDMFVLPTRAEGMPLAIMEAMAKGLPVCATAVSGIPEQLGGCGLLLPDPGVNRDETIDALASAIATLSSDHQGRTDMGRRLRERAQTMFTEDRMLRETLQVLERACLPSGDYVSEGLEVVRPDSAFPCMIKGNPDAQPWPYLRREANHNWYVDSRAPMVGFLSRDEAHILYNTARANSSFLALEIGAWLGWSACHLALGGVQLDVIDPLLKRADFRQSVEQSLEAAGVRERVTLHPGQSPELVRELGANGKRWGLIFIDGDHDGSAPKIDAETCEQFAATDALVLFHDLASPDVSAGLEYFRSRGWNVMVYHTMQVMGVAWRGNAVPLQHFPDPGIGVALPAHLSSFPLSPSPIHTSEPNAQDKSGKPDEAIGNNPRTPLDSPFLHALSRMAEDCIAEARSILAAAERSNPLNAALVTQVIAEHRLGIDNPAAGTPAQLMRRFPGSHRLMSHLRGVFKTSKDVHNYLIADWLTHNGFLEPTEGEVMQEFDRITAAIRDFTFLSRQRLWTLFCAVRQLCLDDVPGDIVECGTWRGGSAALLAATVKRYSQRPRRVWCCDTFTGMPAATDADIHRGVHANETPWGEGSLVAPRSEYLDVITTRLQVQDTVTAVPGLFENTLPRLVRQVSEIALLHADGDWYTSTATILSCLLPNLVNGGIIQIDDYGFWDGCRRAVHEYETRCLYRFNLQAIDDTGVWHRVGMESSAGTSDQIIEFAEACALAGAEEESVRLATVALAFQPNSIRARQLVVDANAKTQSTVDSTVAHARELLGTGRGSQAIKALQALVAQLPPDHLKASFWLALIDASLVENRLGEALQICQALIQRHPDDDDVICRYATVYLALNDTPSAVEVLRPVLVSSQRMYKSRVLLAKIATILDDRGLVVSALEPVLASDAPESTFDPSLHQMYQQAQRP
ncbi:MAG: glycosyltransferase [Actinobacteria bacterium]|uniref:Glycosyltransferase n=1 Tax=Candidatus Fonsibacter lacus TaxID=2576439 RepID=A0A965GCJ4_9PROT|nr:glycosyltransferase [Candidatus Fonsibacter lacus]